MWSFLIGFGFVGFLWIGVRARKAKPHSPGAIIFMRKVFTVEYVILFLKGAAIGIANAIPGVSGGTIAVVTKVFDKLMEAVTLNVKKLVKNMPFLFPLGLGLAAGLFLTAKILTRLLVDYAVPTQLFFVGVIIGSLPIIYKECTKEKKIRLFDLIPFSAGLAVMVCMAVFANREVMGSDAALDFKTAIGIVGASFIAAAVMLIPGVSGSLMLKVLGFYDMAINAVDSLNFPLLALFGIGAVAGIIVIAKVLSILLLKCRKPVYCVILGLIVGSVPGIFPNEFQFDAQGIAGIALCLFGAGLPALMELPQKIIKKRDN